MGVKQFLTMREEHRIRMFENRLQGKKFRPERDGERVQNTT
jgi:hypothetical protein